MDLSALIEARGEPLVLAAGGAVIGLLFGLAAQRCRFCARAAVIECGDGAPGGRLAVWLLAFAAALLGTQLVVLTGHLKPEATRFLSGQGSLSGAAIGGLLFGAGMILTRGCASRLLILSGSGNLRALISGLVFAVAVQASIGGWLVPLRQFLASLWLIDGGTGRGILSAARLGPGWGVGVALAVLLGAMWLFQRKLSGRLWLALGAIGTGLMVPAGWAYTQAVATRSFEPVPLQSLSFSGPSAEWLMRVLASQQAPSFGFDAGLLPGTFIGALAGAVLWREFRFEGFKTENPLGHYITGAFLMGFGAVLAGGCTVGAGMTGGALFAVTAWLTLACIWAGATLTLHLHRRMGWAC